MTKTENNHLTTDEILMFISFDKVTPETLKLVSRVNDHIGVCKECFDKVSAFQTIQDEFEGLKREKFLRSDKEHTVTEHEVNI